MATGASVVLSAKELKANEVLMGHKLKEYDAGFVDPEQFLPARHFFKTKEDIEKSPVFKIIQKLPKGGSLHSHDIALVSHEFLFTLTYTENLYGCWKDGVYLLRFFNENFTNTDCDWELVSTLRSLNSSFNDFLKSKLTLVVDNPEEAYPDLNSVWTAFEHTMATVSGLLGYRPVWDLYLYQVLRELYEDNVMYLEFRGVLPEIYELDGSVYPSVKVVEIYRNVVERFKQDYPNFHGARFIYAPNRKVDNKTVDEYAELCLELLEKFPEFVAGFDLVGQEDLGYPLDAFIPQLLKLQQNGTRFFFHAGETSWNGEPTDLNLFDAVLLNTTRIGHGYAILKHPLLQEMVKARGIALEISPISNQVLKLVEDMRNHPGSVLLSRDFPVVITPDDPSLWGAKGLSYDWYMAFMGMANRGGRFEAAQAAGDEFFGVQRYGGAREGGCFEEVERRLGSVHRRVAAGRPPGYTFMMDTKFVITATDLSLLSRSERECREDMVTIAEVLLFFPITLALADYWQDRSDLIKKDRSTALGASLTLSSYEQQADDILMRYKLREYDEGLVNPSRFLASQHFFNARKAVEQSEVFKFIRKLPKGALLHTHFKAMVSEDYLFNVTYKDNLYCCWQDENLFLHFFKDNITTNDDCFWQLLSDFRTAVPNFDSFLKSRLSLVVKQPGYFYPDINSVWRAFEKTFGTVQGLLGYKPVLEEYLYHALEELYDDGIIHLEFRESLPNIYDLNGTNYDKIDSLKLYQDVIKKFKSDHPGFHGVKMIHARQRQADNDTFQEYIDTYLKLLEKYPGFVAGFDLNGQEDIGRPLVDFIPQLLQMKENGTKFFFHAGETNWNGAPSDMNLFDAILLNATRIGHAYAILKHPLIQEMVKERRIALEISPISNQVLKLVNDFRNHPGSILIANNFPVVITNDDPSFWGAKGLSYDWYIAFMGMANKGDGLRFLKQLAINSIEYSSLQATEKEEVYSMWKKEWDKVMETILTENKD
ncbi:hypothetical protein NQ315_001176 [Exocentrus adspersus]|uniref:Adenosine deaminase n=1 Tax=Exocentrus adspersus TaxID=1586481 RepID=A0AAV8WFK1_9CUCU|nr:hypothetical protein NQ315_001176 [Exocentrus adspersus]